MGEALVVEQLDPLEQTVCMRLSWELILESLAQGDTTHGITREALIASPSRYSP